MSQCLYEIVKASFAEDIVAHVPWMSNVNIAGEEGRVV